MRPPATIWIDVEDLFDYFRYNPHPSGIQRVALDIIRALQATPTPTHLVRSGAKLDWQAAARAGNLIGIPGPGAVHIVEWSALQAVLHAEPEPEPDADIEDDRSFRARAQRTIERWPPEIRDPLIRARVLQGQVVINARALYELVRPPPPRPLRATPPVAPGDGARLAPGDLYLCLGAPWSVRGAAARNAYLHRSGVRTALLLHDLIPVRRPEWFPPDRVDRFRTWLHASLEHTDTLLTLSRFTAADITAYATQHGLRLPAIQTLSPGGSTLQPGTTPTSGLPVANRYVLFVSTLEARKNHALAVQVWQRLMQEVRAGTRPADSVPQLVFAGRIGTGVADILQQLDNSRWLNGRIRLIREPGDAELHALYRNCLFTFLPSLFEGWGLPLGESLAAGAPCLAASGTALPEAGGDFCRYFDPEDVTDAHHAVAALLDTPGALAAARAAIATHHRPADWSAAAAAIAGLA